jgi:hypothetical protein
MAGKEFALKRGIEVNEETEITEEEDEKWRWHER